MTKRNTKEANTTREHFYTDLEKILGDHFSGHDFLGRGTEGLVFENEEGLAVVLKVVTKAIDFDAADAVEEYDEKQAEKEAKVKKAEARKNGSVKVVKEAKEKEDE